MKAMKTTMNATKWLVLGCLALSLAACGDNGPTLLADDAYAGSRADGSAGALPGAGVMTLQLVNPNASFEAGTSQALEVRLVHSSTGVFVPEQNINFSVVTAAGAGTSLSSAGAITNGSGVAKVDLRMGPIAGQTTIRAEHPKATPLDIHVDVTAATAGSVRVDITNPSSAPVTLSPYRATFYDSAAVKCEHVAARVRLPEPLVAATGPNSPLEQQGLPATNRYTVVVDALGDTGISLAQGCVQDVQVIAGNSTSTQVTLELVPMQPSGEFEVTSTWDFSEAIASQNAATNALIRVIEFLANPGEAIYDMVLDQVEDIVGINPDLLLDIAGVKDRLIDYINTQLFKHVGIETYSAMAADLSSMLNQLQVKSALTIDKTDPTTNQFTGREEWTEVTVFWTWKCEESNGPECGKHVIDLAEDGLGGVSYEWTGRVDGYDELVVESYQATIDTGAILLFLLENVMLPKLTNGNAHSIEEAITHFVDCDTLARKVTRGDELCDPTGIFCIGTSGVASACNAATGKVAEWIADPIRDISTPVDMMLSGRAKLQDGTSNGVADLMTDGLTEGRISSSGEPIRVEWTAARPVAPRP